MENLAKKILSYAAQLPEGTPLTAKELLHLGKRAAVDQALYRLGNRGKLFRASQGVYVRPIESRFGTHAPAVSKVINAIAEQNGETVVASGATAANSLGLTTQVPVREVYLTSGRSRQLKLGKQVVELRHASRRQLVLPNQPAGDVVRALAWLGPEKSAEAIRILERKMPKSEIEKIFQRRAQLPTWMAEKISTLVGNG